MNALFKGVVYVISCELVWNAIVTVLINGSAFVIEWYFKLKNFETLTFFVKISADSCFHSKKYREISRLAFAGPR